MTPRNCAHLISPNHTSSQEEAEYWVPSEAARLGLEFMSAKIPHASPKVIMDFLRSMNKVSEWRN